MMRRVAFLRVYTLRIQFWGLGKLRADGKSDEKLMMFVPYLGRFEEESRAGEERK